MAYSEKTMGELSKAGYGHGSSKKRAAAAGTPQRQGKGKQMNSKTSRMAYSKKMTPMK